MSAAAPVSACAAVPARAHPPGRAAQPAPAGRDQGTAEPRPLVHVVLLGTGTVGRAVLQRLHGLEQAPLGVAVRVQAVANTRACWTPAAVHPAVVGDRAAGGDGTGPLAAPLAALGLVVDARGDHATGRARMDWIVGHLDPGAPRIVIDATASATVAREHARWLARGLHVVTACKLARGDGLRRWQAIEHAARIGSVRYGDAATVGAGLPLLSSLRHLRAGGDRIHGIAGVLSGSMAWLLHAFDGTQPFSALVARAQAAGYTEPDPRDDLGGADVRRKLLILARAAGIGLHAADVQVDALVPTSLMQATQAPSDWQLLDAPMAARLQQARAQGRVLRFVGRWQHGHARVGIEALTPDDPLALGTACDNRVVIHSDRYRAQPLVIQGPGAGADVTAAALLDDVLAAARASQCLA